MTTVRGSVLEPSFCVPPATLLIRDLHPELTDQQNRWRDLPREIAPYQLEYVTSARLKNFDFAELYKVYPGPQRPAPQGSPAVPLLIVPDQS
jgi:hypothetical protein